MERCLFPLTLGWPGSPCDYGIWTTGSGSQQGHRPSACVHLDREQSSGSISNESRIRHSLKAETGVTTPQGKECQGLSAATRSREGGLEQTCPESPHEELALHAPWSQTSNLQSRETMHFWHLSHPVCGASLRQPQRRRREPGRECFNLNVTVAE